MIRFAKKYLLLSSILLLVVFLALLLSERKLGMIFPEFLFYTIGAYVPIVLVILSLTIMGFDAIKQKKITMTNIISLVISASVLVYFLCFLQTKLTVLP